MYVELEIISNILKGLVAKDGGSKFVWNIVNDLQHYNQTRKTNIWTEI
jgi:hypothetical protein